MKIYLLDINPHMTKAWEAYFKDIDDVEIVNTDFDNFMFDYTVDAVVSPANAFGLMDGGYDKAIIDFLGERAQTNVFTMLNAVYNGYQPIGTCLSVPFGEHIILHTPTMRTPEVIIDHRVIFDCTRSCLLEANKRKCKSIVIPAFGGLTGRVPYDTIARLMFFAYEQLHHEPKLNWGYACYVAKELRQ